MDWTSIIITLLTCGFLFTLYETIRYRKEHKTMKESEALNSNTEAQSNQMDLVEKYYLKVSELTENSNNTVIGRFNLMDQRLDKIDFNILAVRNKQDLMEEYLNGPYHEWLAQKERCNSVQNKNEE